MKAIVYTKYGLPDASYYQTLSTLLLSVGNWTYLLGLGLVFTISALILNFVLYQSRFNSSAINSGSAKTDTRGN
jgi:hypothetical protein